jgi:hypothetical protein
VCIAEEDIKDFLGKNPHLALLRRKLRRASARGRKPRRVERKYALTAGSNRPGSRYVSVPITESHLNRWGGTGYTVERLANIFLFGRSAQGDRVALHSGIAAARLQVVVVSGSRHPHRLPPVADSNRHLCWEGGLLLCYADPTAKRGFEGLVRVAEQHYTVGYTVAGGRLHEKFMLH